MSLGPVAACTKCSRLIINTDPLAEVWGWQCEAFPEGVPAIIYAGGNPHTSPVEGDHGIRFEPKEK
jgi:hypothetical protein